MAILYTFTIMVSFCSCREAALGSLWLDRPERTPEMMGSGLVSDVRVVVEEGRCPPVGGPSLVDDAAVQLIIVNNCDEELWPGILGNPGQQNPKDGGFKLNSGEEVVLDLPDKWAGRLWGRQGCSFDAEGKGQCETGDCASQIHCRGTSGVPPTTVVEMTFGSSVSPLHYYDVSLVDGFNLPVSMKPVGGGVGCGVAKCDADLNVCCPSALEVKKGNKVVGCKSACLAMQSAKYCCTGEFSDPKTCKPTVFANLFKAICPKAYTYAYDDSSSLNRCRAPRYVVTFCPPK